MLPSAPPMAIQRYASIGLRFRVPPQAVAKPAKAGTPSESGGVISAETVRRFSHFGKANSIAADIHIQRGKAWQRQSGQGNGRFHFIVKRALLLEGPV